MMVCGFFPFDDEGTLEPFVVRDKDSLTVSCDCGAEKAKTTHIYWCSVYKAEK